MSIEINGIAHIQLTVNDSRAGPSSGRSSATSSA